VLLTAGEAFSMSSMPKIRSFVPDNVKVEIGLEGKRRVIDFGKLGRLRASFDISADIRFGPDGYATLSSQVGKR
jgi:hypothetical protein